MRASILAALAVLFCAGATPASAHPAPFSYIDVRIDPSAIDVTVVVHAYDAAHDLGIGQVEHLLDAPTLATHAAALTALVRARLDLRADGSSLGGATWSAPEPLPERQSVRLRARFSNPGAPGVVSVRGLLFPYDPVHQTFVNLYERESLRAQAILSRDKPHADYFPGTAQGTMAVIRKFAAAGVHHILIGPDHLLFLIGLLLLGGSIRQLVVVVSAFTAAHSVTLSLAALDVFNPSPRIVEPAIALSIVYVGADNLTVRGGRDVRGWIAFAFGLVHGFGFASVLRDMDLPARALGWSLFSFNAGVELGQLLVVLTVASLLAAVRSRSEVASRRVAVAGSLIVIGAGAFWFIERVFFPGSA